MSHFVVGVMLPEETFRKGDPEVGEAIESLLAPYSEHIEVEPYDRKCYCVGTKASIESRKKVNWDERFDALRKKFGDDNPVEDVRGIDWGARDALWQEARKPLEEEYEAALKAHPMNGKPNPDCGRDNETGEWYEEEDPEREQDYCRGTGKIKTTYNPKSKWDWYVVGGRWDGYLYPEEDERPSTHLARNARIVSELTADEDFNRVCPYAIVTPDGIWSQQGEMGWFGMSSGDKKPDEWRDEAKALLNAHPEHVFVAVDCHI